MHGVDLSGLLEDLTVLEMDAEVVKAAVDTLDEAIYQGINTRQYCDASHIRTKILNELTPSQRQRVLKNIVGRYYEHEESKHQYRVVEDSNDGELRLVTEQMSKKYLHIDRR